MRRSAALVLSGLALVVPAACGGGGDDEAQGTTGGTVPTTTTPPEEIRLGNKMADAGTSGCRKIHARVDILSRKKFPGRVRYQRAALAGAAAARDTRREVLALGDPKQVPGAPEFVKALDRTARALRGVYRSTLKVDRAAGNRAVDRLFDSLEVLGDTGQSLGTGPECLGGP